MYSKNTLLLAWNSLQSLLLGSVPRHCVLTAVQRSHGVCSEKGCGEVAPQTQMNPPETHWTEQAFDCELIYVIVGSGTFYCCQS